MRFEFGTVGRIIFGPGTFSEAIDLIGGLTRRRFDARVLVVTGRDPERAAPLFEVLRAYGMDTVTFSVDHEPDIELIEQGRALACAEWCDCVVGFGGGAVLDAAKAVAVMATDYGLLTDYLELIGRGLELTKPGLPLLAIPTTAGTGSEVTRNSVIISPEHRVKVSLRSPLLLPTVALLDPELTYSLPPDTTATTGLDALAQLIEPFVCRRANPLTDGLCREGMVRVARALRRAVQNGSDAAAREDMMVASLFGGLALANAGLGAVHGLAGPLGGMISAPHGALCAALLPHVVAGNLAALRERASAGAALGRYEEMARVLTGDPLAAADDAVEWLDELTAELGILGLGSYGMRAEDIPGLVEKAARASSMKANPVELTGEELAGIVAAAL
jgi:alcohol dehydrogenase class IV